MRLEHKGAAKASTLTAPLGGTLADMSFTGADLTNWPDGSVGPFYVTANKGTIYEEKILCASRSGNTVTVWTDGVNKGRAADGTVIQTHGVNSPIEHTWTAAEADAANAHIEETTTAHGVTFANLALEADLAAVAADLVLTDAAVATKADRISEPFATLNVVAHAADADLSAASNFLVINTDGNYTINFTNVPTTNGRIITASVINYSGTNGYIPSAIKINGTSQAFVWQDGVTPTSGAPSKYDFFNFVIFRNADAWAVVANSVGSF